MQQQKLAGLITNAKALIEIDRRVVEAVLAEESSRVDALIKEFKSKHLEVQAGLAILGDVESVNHETHDLLLRVQRKLPTESLIAALKGGDIDELSFYEPSDERAWELGSELLYSWISHYEYVRDLFRVNSLVLKTKISPTLSVYLNEARQCYAFQQWNAVIALSRTILEVAAKDLCQRKGLLEKNGANIKEINQKVFHQLINGVARGPLKASAVKVYYAACPVIHGDRVVNSAESLNVLRNTIAIVQKLYSSAGL